MPPRVYGWKKQPPDDRDYSFADSPHATPELPRSVDLRPQMPPVYDQGRIGSCTANAIAAALQFCQIKEGFPNFTPSRLFIYWNERSLEGTIPKDAGAVIRDGLKVVSTIGACAEKNWSYDDTPADPATGIFPAGAKARKKPNCFAYRHAKDADALSYFAVPQQLDQMRACLALGFPFVFGFQVYPSFESAVVAASGIVPMPSPGERSIGGHAVLAVGYDDARRVFIVRNSWGESWGMAGYFEIPYDYLSSPSLASDCWTIRSA